MNLEFHPLNENTKIFNICSVQAMNNNLFDTKQTNKKNMIFANLKIDFLKFQKY